jgi:hypothetical protein
MSKPLASIIVHAHPAVELRVTRPYKDETGWIGECVLLNLDRSEAESSFFLTEDVAREIMSAMQLFIDKCGEAR